LQKNPSYRSAIRSSETITRILLQLLQARGHFYNCGKPSDVQIPQRLLNRNPNLAWHLWIFLNDLFVVGMESALS
jgi:hypothetical protein